MPVNKEKIVAKLEALLFIYGEALFFKKISQTLDMEEQEVKEAVMSLAESYKDGSRGLQLVVDDEKVQLTTKPEFGKLLEDMVKGELHEELTSASLETLSIIIYSAPISRAEVDYIRGVNSTFILRNLLIRGLIERELDPKRANAFIYKPSFEFLRHLGISKKEDLPEFEQFQQLIKSLRQPESNSDGQQQQAV
ncbi:MAG: SMC-Scp complex subunit ScpB [Candidatus Harrisonbacteria bacterium RIFCSPLOWO2_02_FULL_41_13b]|uniref:SMC-Scp complex subunit ScpB n=1 Tax=Candidatus Harrisonbacteria bacterium RIFCSPLOWO2_02_FULL_41_13b TaxID=1798409 RepID=A0A1G1ZUB6_9BACT|nr:MAG: SMC-Scp complex subunit ScpB [Candidatus Harrisonbacteria bacterium RIFCSPHIGHO2_02_FULL_40_20]OGY68172.1 MAG: SMC-Scp complex subunit ScpB [Candidatus Harrisonbacteria bacterium RIFCSPLOWO2_02_FULL_41_13b]